MSGNFLNPNENGDIRNRSGLIQAVGRNSNLECSNNGSNIKRSYSAKRHRSNSHTDRIELYSTDKIPMRKRGIEAGISRENVVKIYHELTDSFGNPLRNSKTFNLKDK